MTRLIANARMYSATTTVKAAWRELFAWVARTSGVALDYLDHAAPAPLEDLWARDDLGAAFMCGFPFAARKRSRSSLAAPVPSPARYGGAPRYCTDLVVRAEGRFSTCRYVRRPYRLDRQSLAVGLQCGAAPSARAAEARFEWVGPLVTPRAVIDALLDDRIDVGPSNSYVHDLLRRHEPETAANCARRVNPDDADPRVGGIICGRR